MSDTVANCPCSRLPDAFYLEDLAPGFADALTLESTSDWTRLMKCPACTSLWAIDEWDKYQNQVAVRVDAPENWQGATEEQRKLLLLDARGGEVEGECLWASCKRQPVNGVEFCVDHLYANGTRR